MTFKNIVARNIAKYRKASGLTQSELAERLNYSDKSVSKWERAEGTPDTETLVAMARLFGVTINELISDADVPCEGATAHRAEGESSPCGGGESVGAECENGGDGDSVCSDSGNVCDGNVEVGGSVGDEVGDGVSEGEKSAVGDDAPCSHGDAAYDATDIATSEGEKRPVGKSAPNVSDNSATGDKKSTGKSEKKPGLTLTKIAITVMAVAAVWVLCGITAFLFSAIAPSVAAVWNRRIAAYFTVLSLLVWYIFAAIWWGALWRTLFASALTWSAAAALHLSFPSENPLYICAVAAAFQVIIICAALVAKDIAKRR